MKRIWRDLPCSVAALALLTFLPLQPVQAAEGKASVVEMRASERDGFTRLVFQGEGPVMYKGQQSGNALTLTFDKPVTVKMEGTPPSSLPRISGYKVLNSKTVEIDFPKGIGVRHFSVGNRIFVDLEGQPKVAAKATAKDSTKKTEQKPQSLAPTPAKKPMKEETSKLAKENTQAVQDKSDKALKEKLEKASSQIKVDDFKEKIHTTDAKEESSAPESVKETEDQKPQAAPREPYEITVAGTTGFAMAAFEKGGELWLVVDNPDMVIPPQIEGPDADRIKDFERLKSGGMSIFKWPIPKGYKIYADGGGLLWKIHLVDGKTDPKSPPHPLTQSFNLITDNAPVTGMAEEITAPELPHAVPAAEEMSKVTPHAGGDDDDHAKEKSAHRDQAEGNVKARAVPAVPAVPSLVFEADTFRRSATITDPDTGEKIMLGLVDTAKDYSGEPQHFVQLKTLPSVIGTAIISKIDDLSMSKIKNGAKITSPSGLILSTRKDILMYKTAAQKPTEEEGAEDGKLSRIFDFKEWKGGGIATLNDNQSLILSSLLQQNDQKKSENLIALGRMMISNGFAPEAFGFFDLAERFTPDVGKSPAFIALRGASEALSGNEKQAFRSLSHPLLGPVGEIGFWKSYALAGLDDWKQAANVLPDKVDMLKTYPSGVLWPLGLKLGEVALREGNTKKAKEILDIIKESKKHNKMSVAHAAALAYLEGELMRQNRNEEKAKELWSVLETGKDDLYRAKSRLAMTMMQYGDKTIAIDKAIDNLEGLRYAWRGDGLEASVDFNLGKLYLEKGMPVRALGLMRQAANLIPNSEQGKRIRQIMNTTFQDLYLTDKIKDLSPVEALTLYNEFSELVPAGAEGDRLARQLAERLADVDLLPRAIALLEKQIDNHLTGIQGASVAIRLAALQIQDGKARSAMETLDKAEGFLTGQDAEEAASKQRAIGMLRSKAYSMLGKSEDAFKTLTKLSQDEDILRLRADIAWKAKKWQESADALEQLIAKQNISLTRPLTNQQAQLVLNWALSLYLADNRYVLANLRERYGDLMSQSKYSKEFEVVTRPRQNVLLADRNTIQSVIGETDLFGDFLDSFKENLSGPLSDTEKSGTSKDLPPMKVPDALKDAGAGIQTDQVQAD